MIVYEDLRREVVLHRPSGGELGMALFLRERMAGWLTVWEMALPAPDPLGFATQPPELPQLPLVELRVGVIQSLARMTSLLLPEVPR